MQGACGDVADDDGGIFGVSIYFKTKLGDFESRTKREIIQAIEDARAEEPPRRSASIDPSASHDPLDPI